MNTARAIEKSDAFRRICRLAGRAAAEFGMIREHDRIVAGVSGGEDSLILAHVLEHLRRRAPFRFEWLGAFVDMGFPGMDPAPLARYFAQRGWRFEVIALPGAELLETKNTARLPCSLCARLRRGRLYGLADRVGAGVIALGHHLDDLCASFLISLFRGNGLKTMGPNVPADSGRKRLIRPLCRVSKRLIREAAAAEGAALLPNCPFAGQVEEHGDRAWIEQLLDRLERRFPAVRQAMWQSMSRVEARHLLDPRLLEESDGGK